MCVCVRERERKRGKRQMRRMERRRECFFLTRNSPRRISDLIIKCTLLFFMFLRVASHSKAP